MESRLVIELIQQSPMIHFQHDEEGAALRATDVKPRLDRFLIEEYKKENNGKNVPEDWVQPGQPEALKYRMRIEAPNEKAKSADPIKGLYFGNMGEGTRPKKMISYKKPLRMEIICFVKGLRKYIARKIKLFFFLYNFGTRQNKGFGSFIVKDSGTYAEKLLLHYFGERTIYKIDYTLVRNINAVEILKDVNELYKVMKGGVNYKGIYIKSSLIDYFLGKHIGSEKRWMKESHIAPVVGKRYPQKPVDEYRYVRALLGVGERQEWNTDIPNASKKETITITGKAEEQVSEQSRTKKIQRMPSPIVFKIIGQVLYVFPYEPNEKIYGEEFIFHNKNRETFANYPEEELRILRVPEKTQFDMGKFMRGIKDSFEDIRNCFKNIEGRKPKFCLNDVNLVQVKEEVKS